MEERGDYEAAREALNEFWLRTDDRPSTFDLETSAAAELLLRAGVLLGWLGSVRQVKVYKQKAHHLLGSSMSLFEQVNNAGRIAETHIEEGWCYWREGDFLEAKKSISEGLQRLGDNELELKAVALVRLAEVERSAHNLDQALKILTNLRPLVDRIENDSIKGRFYTTFATVLKNSGEDNKNSDYIDQAYIEYAAASFYFNRAGHARFQASVENNLGNLYRSAKRFDEAHHHLKTAHRLFTQLKDDAHTAQVNETRSRLLLEEGRYHEAERTSREAVETLSAGSRHALLAEALITRGLALVRLERRDEAQDALHQAYEAAEICRDRKKSAGSMLTLLEELFEHVSHRTRVEAIKRASQALGTSRDAVDLSRLHRSEERVRLAEEERERQRLIEAEAMRRKAYFDQLTNLPNRRSVTEFIDAEVEKVIESSSYHFALLYIDLDRVKQVNDNYGHSAGDQLLIQVARRLENCLRSQDSVGRIGGDEFAIILRNAPNPEDASRIAERVQKVFETKFDLDGHEVFTTASIGVAVSTAGCISSEQMLRDADTAMYRAKKMGVGRCEVFNRDMHFEKLKRLQLEQDLRHAIDKQEFHLNYQPIVNIGTGELAGFEALVRWKHSEWGLVSPAEFIPIAEETGMILRLGQWVLAESCRQMKEWQNLEGVLDAGLMISVNLSSKQLTHRNLVEEVEHTLAQTGFKADLLKLEITESAVTENEEVALEKLQQLQAMGIKLSLDDFGTGQSSLNRLRRYPVSTLKIDRSFVKDINSDEGHAFVDAIVTLAKSLKMSVVAEGVEHDDQLRALAAFKCEYAQGFLLAKPLTPFQAIDLIKSNRKWEAPQNTIEKVRHPHNLKRSSFTPPRQSLSRRPRSNFMSK